MLLIQRHYLTELHHDILRFRHLGRLLGRARPDVLHAARNTHQTSKSTRNIKIESHHHLLDLPPNPTEYLHQVLVAVVLRQVLGNNDATLDNHITQSFKAKATQVNKMDIGMRRTYLQLLDVRVGDGFEAPHSLPVLAHFLTRHTE